MYAAQYLDRVLTKQGTSNKEIVAMREALKFHQKAGLQIQEQLKEKFEAIFSGFDPETEDDLHIKTSYVNKVIQKYAPQQFPSKK